MLLVVNKVKDKQVRNKNHRFLNVLLSIKVVILMTSPGLNLGEGLKE